MSGQGPWEYKVVASGGNVVRMAEWAEEAGRTINAECQEGWEVHQVTPLLTSRGDVYCLVLFRRHPEAEFQVA